MGSNRTPVMILMMVATLVCAAIIVTAAAGALLLLPSSVFAQQQEETSLGEEEGEDLGSGIASDVLDSIGVEEDEQQEENDGAAATRDDDGDTNTQIAVPITDQDQREANLAEQLGLNADILEEEEVIPTQTPTPTPEEEDTTPPILTVPEDRVVEATSTEGVVVRFTVTAQDNVDGAATLDERNVLTQHDDVGGDITISCTPASGSTFEIGTTTVTCTATDEAGNRATASFTVTVAVADTIAPEITGVPADITVRATSLSGATVSYTIPTATDAVDGSVPVTCSPESGSIFPIGTTRVVCTATDTAGNTATASFTITVNAITCLGVAATIYGTEGNDDLPGTEGRDIIVALGGNDRVQALGGDDAVCGGDGDDTLTGGEGNDGVFGEAGSDTLTGGAGNDQLNGGAGSDSMSGGEGNDVMSGGAGSDTLTGDAGNDQLNGDAGDDALSGDAGTDSADGGPNTDTCFAETETNCEL